jgi:hypothetical protein
MAMHPQIRRSALKPVCIVGKLAERAIAGPAQQTADAAGGVTVVCVELSRLLRGEADRALSALAVEQRHPSFGRQRVFRPQVGSSVRLLEPAFVLLVIGTMILLMARSTQVAVLAKLGGKRAAFAAALHFLN